MVFPPSLNVAFLSPFLAALVSSMCRPLGVLMFKKHTYSDSFTPFDARSDISPIVWLCKPDVSY